MNELDASIKIKNYIDNLLPPNLFVYGSQYQLKFYGLESTEDLIACCKKGISTVSSTVVLNFTIRMSLFCPANPQRTWFKASRIFRQSLCLPN